MIEHFSSQLTELKLNNNSQGRALHDMKWNRSGKPHFFASEFHFISIHFNSFGRHRPVSWSRIAFLERWSFLPRRDSDLFCPVGRLVVFVPKGRQPFLPRWSLNFALQGRLSFLLRRGGGRFCSAGTIVVLLRWEVGRFFPEQTATVFAPMVDLFRPWGRLSFLPRRDGGRTGPAGTVVFWFLSRMAGDSALPLLRFFLQIQNTTQSEISVFWGIPEISFHFNSFQIWNEMKWYDRPWDLWLDWTHWSLLNGDQSSPIYWLGGMSAMTSTLTSFHCDLCVQRFLRRWITAFLMWSCQLIFPKQSISTLWAFRVSVSVHVFCTG